jgi:hypothetical protein
VTTWWDPYAYAGEQHPDWVIRFDYLRGIPEVMCWRRKVILIDPDYNAEYSGKHGRRSCVAHALGHIELMHQGSVLDRKEELAACKWAAGMLIGVEQLADAATWRGWQVGEDLAHDLRVDLDTLITRIGMARCHPAEKSYLEARRAQMEHVA